MTWCEACDWNVDPGKPDEAPGRMEAFRRRLAKSYGEKLYAEVAAGGSLAPHRDPAGVFALVLALAVHGFTAAVALGGLLLITVAGGVAFCVLGVVLLLLAWVLRPRMARLPEDLPVLRRADAPELFALVDEVAALTGTTGVRAVVVDGDFNASVSTYGIRRHRVLSLGLGAWESLTPQERIALLGHELGHFANGDLRHGLVVSNALRSLDTWRYLVAAQSRPQTLMDWLLNLLYLPPRLVVNGLLALLDRLTLRSAQRAEYLADTLAARVGSTASAVALMDKLLVWESGEGWLRREVNAVRTKGSRAAGRDTNADELWEGLAAHMASVPDRERERLRRVGALRGHSVDSSHPPTHLRRACLLAVPPTGAVLNPTDERLAAVSTELSTARATVTRMIVRG
ncbi:M48 family metallopeptidase [uncultured Streptomyces sp.]|uniref:M48 family metallopeptidase n=1 Tax=uncultured Streptomyces sp. TaxID=174707 RepID=UPI0026297404|nr:M48 family metallopeptidase [uncultured Streptomyces sp.]